MDTVSQFILVLLSSSVVAAIVSGVITAVMQKRNEKESRLFNAKLEAYREFSTHLISRFTSLTREGKNPELMMLSEVSARCLLVASESLNKELKALLVRVNDVYERCCAPDYDAEKENDMFDTLWKDAENVENSMRKDLGFE